MNTFQELGLNQDLLKAATDLGFETPSDVQAETIPLLLNNTTDLVALAQTGTGKTAAFGFPLLQQINTSDKATQALILSPTRELCLQITNEIQLYGKYSKLNIVAIYGGASITDQAKQIKRGAHIVVATPGRIKDMIKRGMVDISKIEYCVLDEADEMLNMGFYEDITSILSHTPKEKQTWLFSATMPKEVSIIAKKFMKKPQEVTVGSKNKASTNVSHEYYVVGGRDRYSALKRLADVQPDIFSVIFCRTKRDTQRVAEKLIEDGYNAGAIHGDLSQNQRDLVMKSFRNKQIQMLVATDVAARGIDVEDITHVINYQLPDEIETYTHRSGRTGRAGKTGISMVIITKSEVRKIKQIEKTIQTTFTHKQLPTGNQICEVQLLSLAEKINATEANPEIDPYLDNISALFADTSKNDLIKKVFSVEFGRFFNYYKDSKDLNARADTSNNSNEKSYSNNFNPNSTRYFINVGKKDGYNWMRLKDFLRDTLEIDKDDLFKVDVLNSFSFFNTEKETEAKVLKTFTDFKLDGRFINVEISDDKGGKSEKKHKKSKRKPAKNRGKETAFSSFKSGKGSRPKRSRR